MKSIQTISIIGAGNVASYLAQAFHGAGIDIRQIFSRNIKNAQELSEKVDALAINQLSDLVSNVDLFIVAVSDSGIKEVIEKIAEFDVTIAHTSGAMETILINRFEDNSAVFYPLQTLKKEHYKFDKSIPICITAKQEAVKKILLNFAELISNKAVVVSDRDRLKYHMAAVFSNNFVNHLFSKIYDYLNDEHLNPALLYPLINKTFNQLNDHDLKSLQTGPAVRNDLITEAKHLSLLNQYGDESIMDLYELFSKSIKHYH